MESDKAGGSAPSDGEEQGEQAAVAEQEVQPINNNPLATTNNSTTTSNNDDIDDDHSDPYTDISSMSDNIDNSGHTSSLLLDLDNVNNNNNDNDNNNVNVSMHQNNDGNKAEQPHNLDILQLSKSSSRDSLPPNNSNNNNYYSPKKNSNSSPISTTTNNNVHSPKISPKQLPPPMNILECVTTDNNAMKEPNSPLGSVSVTSLVNNNNAALMTGLGTTGSTPR